MPDVPPWLEQGSSMTKDYEGFSEMPYLDTKKVPTVGYGFNIPANNLPNARMSREEADNMFVPIYLRAYDKAKAFAGESFDNLTDKQQMILTDMSYNLGDKLFGFKNMRKSLLNYDNEGVIREMKNSDWYSQVGRRSKSHVASWNQSE